MKIVGLACVALSIMIMSGRCRLHSDFFDEVDGRKGNYIKMDNGAVHEEIKYNGQIRIREDETGIEHISPDGYLLFIQNDQKLLIESNDRGELTYNLNDGGPRSTLDEVGKKNLLKLIREMIACGYDAEARAERIYNKGGNTAVLNEVDRIYDDNSKGIYIQRVLNSDSISEGEAAEVLQKISKNLGSDYEKEKLLSKTEKLLKFPEASKEYLRAVEGLGSDASKENLMRQLIDRQTISIFDFDRFVQVIDHLGSDQAKENLLRQLIEKNSVADNGFDELFNTINHLGSDNAKGNLLRLIIDKKIATTQFDKITQSISSLGSESEKSELYRRLIEMDNFSEEQWIAIMNAATHFGSDNEKANVFIEIGKKMPDNQNIKSAYISAAKSIASDADYGRVMKSLR